MSIDNVKIKYKQKEIKIFSNYFCLMKANNNQIKLIERCIY